MLTISSALAVLASLGLLWADVPSTPSADPGTQVAKHRRARPAKAPTAEQILPLGPRGRTQVIFEDLRITGQTTKAGEVRVLNRKPVGMASLIRMRAGFRTEIIQTVFPDKATCE